MIKGININETKKYVSKFDTDTVNPTYFLLGCLDPILQANIEDEAITFEKSSPDPKALATALINQNLLRFRVLQFGIKGLENFADPLTNEPVKFEAESVIVRGKKYDGCPERIIKMIPKEIREELTDKILDWNKFSEGEAKN